MSASIAINDPVLVFGTIFGLLFALFLLLSGAFTAYFGSGKSRRIGYALVAGGLVVFVLLGLYFHFNGGALLGSGVLLGIVEETIIILLAAILGALAAIGLFLVAIMKS